MSFHFFISRAGKDSECAQWNAGVLDAVGRTFTLQDFGFKTGRFVDHIQHVLDSGGLIAITMPRAPSQEPRSSLGQCN